MLARRPGIREEIHLDFVSWDSSDAPTPLVANLLPQEAINRGMPRPSECDIAVVIFSRKLGTPFEDERGEQFESGTDWELRDALRQTPPTTLIFRRVWSEIDVDAWTDVDRMEYLRLKAYLASDLFRLSGGGLRGAREYRNPTEFSQLVAAQIEELVLDRMADLRRTQKNETWPPRHPARFEDRSEAPVTIPATAPPFPGLRSMDERDTDNFFGRDPQVKAVTDQLSRTHLLWLTGPSGNGKSSLVAAGILPYLRRGGLPGSHDWHYAKMTPGPSPLRGLYRALTDCFPNLRYGRPLHDRLGSVLEFTQRCEAGGVDLSSIVSSQADRQTPTALLLFIDQFEECFTVAEEMEARGLFRLLKAAPSWKALRVIVTIRHDFLGKVIEISDLGETLSGQGFFSLPAPPRDALRSMIEGPARKAALDLEEGLTELLLDDTGNEPGGLALMAFALDELYNGRYGNVLTVDTYRTLGGVNGAICARAEGTFIDQGMDAASLHDLFGCLVDVNDAGVPTRKKMRERDIASTRIRALLNSFITARLVSTTTDPQSYEPLYEVAHEAVFREWPRLHDWIAETWESHRVISRMEREAGAWEARGRPSHLLPNHEQIQEYQTAETRLFRERRREKALDDFLRPEQERLLRALSVADCAHDRRREIGDRLAAIGDNRPGVGVKGGIPDISWIASLGGRLCVAGRTMATDPILIAAFPVTTSQFDAFLIAEDGYNDPRNWIGTDRDFVRQAIRSERNRIANTPRDSISWYQARAFARWLDRRLAGQPLAAIDGSVSQTVRPDCEIRLPTEWEWQMAAQGGSLARSFPWGAWNGDRANTAEAGLGRSLAVGMYPEGRTSSGIYDMAGNVAEWCLNNHDLDNDDFDRDCSKVLKGGSYYHGAAHAATDFRRKMLPSNAFSNFGFRLVVGRRQPEMV
jgi:formylglycine-generating enzyme required for sulfatase activity